MAKLTLSDISSGYLSGTTYTANNTAIETAVENTLSRDGTAPNQMGAALDMNSYAINNLPNAASNSQPVTLGQASTLLDTTVATRESIGALLYPRTAAEISAAVTPTNYEYEPGNVLRYGTNTTPGTTDMTTAVQAAIDVVYTAGGGVAFVPAGTYAVGALTLNTNVRLVGEGSAVSILKSSHTGDGLSMTSTINTSTAVNTSVEKLKLWNTNASNTGGGYVDVCGTFVNVFDVTVFGFLYGIIFDQTELATVRQAQVGQQATGGAGIWLVNGPDHTVGATAGFTNRITIQECQINVPAGCYGIIDDGGYTHSFINNNFNAGTNNLCLAGINGLFVSNNEFESATSSCITFDVNTKIAGTAVGACVDATFISNVIVPAVAQTSIDCTANAPQRLILIGNLLGSSSAASITGASNIAKLYTLGNTELAGTVISGNPTFTFRDGRWGTESSTFVNTISASEENKTLYLNNSGGFTTTLPVPTAGLKYKFIVGTAPTSSNYILTTNSSANIFYGTLLDIVGEQVAITAQDTINFVANTSLIGDSVEVESDGTNWYVTAKSLADGGITVAVT